MSTPTHHKPLRTALIGFGKVGAGYGDDPIMARHYPYASHAQVLAAHPAFEWGAVVDVSQPALASARDRWRVPHVASTIAELAHAYKPEIAVLATPPATRLELLDHLPSLRAVLVEKPLGETLAQGEAFLAECARRNIAVQVNLWRRADELFHRLANGYIQELIGRPQAVFGIYGNGLRNNGTHLVDFARMLFGEVIEARIIAGANVCRCGPLPNDLQMPFSLAFESGFAALFQPVEFAHFRENSLDVWGSGGRITIMQEGLSVHVFPLCPHRATQHEQEIASDCPRAMPSTVGHAFYRMYDNLADAVLHNAPLCSPGPSALRTTAIVEDLMQQAL